MAWADAGTSVAGDPFLPRQSARQSRAAGCAFWDSLTLTVCGPKGQPNQGSIDVWIEKGFPALSDAHNPNPDISQCRVPLG